MSAEALVRRSLAWLMLALAVASVIASSACSKRPPDPAGSHADGSSSGVDRDLSALQARACELAGGRCVAISACDPQHDAQLLGARCRSESTGLVCCRASAACEGAARARCCGHGAQGNLIAAPASCDRGHPSCAGYYGRWLALDGDCTTPSPEPAETQPTRWPGAMGVREAGRWACKEAGAAIVQSVESCDGYVLPLSSEVCCLAKSACPELDAARECCTRSNQPVPKLCHHGRAVCDPDLVAEGMLREVPRGACRGGAPGPRPAENDVAHSR